MRRSPSAATKRSVEQRAPLLGARQRGALSGHPAAFKRRVRIAWSTRTVNLLLLAQSRAPIAAPAARGAPRYFMRGQRPPA
jgi:hypothetical protein